MRRAALSFALLLTAASLAAPALTASAPALRLGGGAGAQADGLLCDGGCNHQATTTQGPANENYVAVDPNDPLHVVVAAKDYSLGPGDACGVTRVWLGYYTTFDGGKTWHDGLVPQDGILSEYGCVSDGVVAIGGDGSVYLSGIAYGAANGDNGVPVFQSTDGGLTFPVSGWASKGGAAVFHDKNWLGVDPATQEVYATWTLFGTGEDIMVSAAKGGAASAAAGALNFSRPQCLSCAGPSLLRDVITDSGGTGSFIAVGTDGTAYVTWIAGSAILLSTSVDQGAHWTPALDVIDIAPGGGGAPYRTPTMPQIAVDRSNALGIVYLTWQGAGAGSDVFVAKSVRGLLWGNPLKVNDDAGNAGQYFPSVCVSPVNGDVYVAWIDSRNDPAHVDYDLYGAVSHDGGTTFGPNVRLSTQSSNPYLSYHQEGYTFIGDYDGSACAKDGTAYSTWPDTRNGRADLFVAHWD